MKCSQSAFMKFDRLYAGWSGLEFSDVNDNKCVIECSDDQILIIEKELITRANRIRRERAETFAAEAAAAAEEAI